ncbi:MAG TPA: hypothetical protein VF862_00990 [Gemmatimonadales bacterium]
MTERRPIERDGLRAGLIAAGAVALFYAGFDQLAARGPLYTVNLLGLALFRGVRDPAIRQLPIAIDTGAILTYTVLHLALSVVIGVIVTRFLGIARREPGKAPMIWLLLVAGGVATILAIGYATGPLRVLLPWWSIVVANALAVAVVGADLLRRHPDVGGIGRDRAG